MALIICPECGKQFSDRAPACPNCGCPTSAIAGADPAGREEAEKQILALVDQTLEKLRSAEDRYRIDSVRAESFANRTTVNLYSRSAQRNISQIVEKTETASAAFHQACQALVPLLDGGCRPLLAAKPGAKAVKAVAGLLALINEKSTIEKDYSVSFNGTDLGKAARSGYAPLRSSLAVQGFWEAEYAKLPDHAEAERFWSEKRSAYLAAGGNKTKKQIENDGYKADILAWMEPDTRYTAMHIAGGVPSLVENGVSGSSVTALLLQLVNAHKLEKSVEGNCYYFWLAAGRP